MGLASGTEGNGRGTWVELEAVRRTGYRDAFIALYEP